MKSTTVQVLLSVVLALAPMIARADGAAAYKTACARCHRTAETLLPRLTGATPEDRAARLSDLLATHHAPDPAARAAIVSYLIGLGG